MEKPQNERMATIEEQLKNLTQLVVDLREDMKRDRQEMRKELQEFKQNYPTRTELEDKLKLRDKEIEQLHKKFEELDGDTKSNRALLVSIGSVIVAIVSIITNIVTK
jgi:chromosome segregation ATPase